MPSTSATGRVVCNLGLWLGVPDINGFDKLGLECPTSHGLHQDRVALASQVMASLSSMNVAFLSELVPAYYQLPMGFPICNSRLDRFGDIWSGYILKRLADRLGDLITVGQPLVQHLKRGDTVRESRAEHYGHLLESYFHELIDDAAEQISTSTYALMYAELADRALIKLEKIRCPPAYRAAFHSMIRSMARWAKLFR